jgi:endonuclease I
MMMKKLTLILFSGIISTAFAQNSNYYNSIQGLTGETLEDALHELVKDHNEFSYSTVKQILRDSDEDPNNSNNIILVYKGISIDESNFASDPNNTAHFDYWNREHVWAKSHGGFGADGDFGDMGAYTDVHNLKPCDMTVNSARGAKDFDNGGTPNSEATDCYSTSTTWEPRDDAKGDIARIIFYMDTRYTGDEGEPSLNVVNTTGTFPNAQMGKLSTLLEWHEQDPVDAFERHRNDVIFEWQGNRNPYIDNENLANYIWNGAALNPISFEVSISPIIPNAEEDIVIATQVFTNSGAEASQVNLVWGTSWFNMTNQVEMQLVGYQWQAILPAQAAGADVKYQIIAQEGADENSFYGNIHIEDEPFTGELISIQEIQGTTDDSPYDGQEVATSGIVTAVYSNNFYIQNGTGARSGLYVYSSPVFPEIGDSVIVSGAITEYYNLTELGYPDAVYILSSNNALPAPHILATGELANEDYEGVLVQVENVNCTYAQFNWDDYGNWKVNDGTGECVIHNTEEGYEHPAIEGEQYGYIRGVNTYTYGEWKIELRMASDVGSGPDTSAPNISSVEAMNETTVVIIFNEDVEESSGENLSNYSISGETEITSAEQHPFQKSRITLTVSNMPAGNLTLTVENVADLLGNTMSSASYDFNYLDVEDLADSTFKIYPNPAVDILHIDASKTIDAWTLMDALGKEVAHSKYLESSTNLNIDVSPFEAGLYFLELEIEGQKIIKQLVIE